MMFIKSYFFVVLYMILIILSHICLLTRADSNVTYHINETFVEYNSTLSDLTINTNESDVESLIVTDESTNATFILTTIETNVTEAVDANKDLTTTVTEAKVEETTTVTEAKAEETSTVTDAKAEETSTVTEAKIEETTTVTEAEVEETTIVANVSCQYSEFGCCSDGLTERMGPNDEGCVDIVNETNATLSNSTSSSNETFILSTTEEMVTENITETFEEMNSTVLDIENSTASVFTETIANDTENSTLIVTKEIISTTVLDDTTTSVAEISESTTEESIETTTQAEITTTTVKSNLCVDGKFECCPDGITPAKGPKFEGCNTTEQLVVPTAKLPLQTVCELEKDAGSCSKYVNMWVYDRQQGKCIRFWYGSCEGNENRFETEQKCQETCVSPKGIEVCLLPKMTGPCQASSIRYYYNREKNECQQFPYGGCNGNENNYQTLEQCQSTCSKETIEQCTQPVQSGPCKGKYNRFYYDTVTGQCRSFLYGGCGKNQNNFVTLKDCLNRCVKPREKDICLQPKIIGTCQERRPTWYFDLIERECKLFNYSGCKGNHNRFATKEECDLSCSSLKTSKTFKNDIKSLCNLPMNRGSCDQQISRWYYNPVDQYCYPYQYTGCNGNGNSFETEQNCREICEAKEKDICTLEKDSGSCDQYKIMWYYDTKIGQCKNFYYGSCGGNANRFETEQACQIRCLLKKGNSTCFQQVDQGHVCNQTKSSQNQTETPIMKFFFDQQLQKCSSFLYHGCGGNENRFDEESKCIEKCVVDVPKVEQGCGSNMIRCNIQCRFGFERDANGCEICRCFEPCQRQQCPSGYECVILPEQTPCTQAPCPVPRVECQLITEQTANGNGGIKPAIENSITNIFTQFDSNVTIPCTLRHGVPAPTIYWYKERQQLQVHDAMSDGIIVRKIERLPEQSLLIRKVTLDDQGLYTCRAINDFGQDIKDVQLELFDPIKVDIYPINRIYQLDFTAKLQCRATGYPSPRITWMRNNIPLQNTTRLKLQNDGSLIIHPYKREDAGPYVCNATNKKESVTQVAYLEIQEIHVEQTCEDQPTFANCELVLRHNFCDVYFDYCCRTCSQHGKYSSATSRSRRHFIYSK